MCCMRRVRGLGWMGRSGILEIGNGRGGKTRGPIFQRGISGGYCGATISKRDVSVPCKGKGGRDQE